MYRSTGDGTSDATAVYGVDNVLEANYRITSTNVDTPMTAISRSQYQGFSNKTSKGIPTQYFVERFIDKTTITLYLTPGAAEDGNKINYNEMAINRNGMGIKMRMEMEIGIKLKYNE